MRNDIIPYRTLLSSSLVKADKAFLVELSDYALHCVESKVEIEAEKVNFFADIILESTTSPSYKEAVSSLAKITEEISDKYDPVSYTHLDVYKRQLCMFQIAVYQKAAWTKASRAPTPGAYCIPRMPAHVFHPLAMQSDRSFLGREIKTQEEVYTTYPTGRCLFLLAAYRLNDSFISLYLKQLETGGCVHVYSCLLYTSRCV